MKFPEWKMLKTLVVIGGLLLVFFVLVELIRIYQTLYGVTPMFGYFFVVAFLVLFTWFLVWLLKSFFSLPPMLKPPKIDDFENRSQREAQMYAHKYAVYLIKYLYRLSKNEHISDEIKPSIQKSLEELKKLVGSKPSLEKLREERRLAESQAIAPALEELKKKSQKEVWASIGTVGVTVALSPLLVLDLVAAFTRNIKMIVRIMEIYQGKLQFIEIVMMLRDLGYVLTYVSFANIAGGVVQRVFKDIAVAGQIVDAVAQGAGAGVLTGVVGNTVIKKCSTFDRRWKPEDAKGGLNDRVKELYKSVGSLIRQKAFPGLMKRHQDNPEQDSTEKAALLRKLGDKLEEAFNETQEFAASCVDMSVKTGKKSARMAKKATIVTVDFHGKLAEKIQERFRLAVQGAGNIGKRIVHKIVPHSKNGKAQKKTKRWRWNGWRLNGWRLNGFFKKNGEARKGKDSAKKAA